MQVIDEYERMRIENQRELWIDTEREKNRRKHGLEEYHYTNFSRMMTTSQTKHSWISWFLSMFTTNKPPTKIDQKKAFRSIYYIP